MEVWGGAVPDSVMRYLDESPWNRLRSVSKVIDGRSKLSALSRGRNLFGYVPYPDNVLRGFYKEAIKNGLPVFGTCAGLIMLAKTQDGEPANRLSTMDIDVRRNAYGRQLGSFYTEAHFEGVGDDVPMTFIRAPYINGVSADAKTLATVGGHIVAARQGAQLVTAFHPELNDDTRIHEYFIDMIRQSKSEI